MTDTLITAAVPTTATPIWVDPFVAQYQMTDTTCCAEAIFNANRSLRWNQSITTAGANIYSREGDQLHYLQEAPPVEHEAILVFAQECLDHYCAERKHAANAPKFGMPEGYNILRYKPGEAYHGAHSDASGPQGMVGWRHLTFGLFLNTTTGGELEFVEQKLKVAPVEGRAVIFPAAWTHAHRSLPATVDRYVLNIFYGFLQSTEP